MPIFVVERVFPSPITDEQFQAGGEKLKPCIEERGITHLGSHVSADGTRSVCLFEGSDAERVREANRTAGLPFERVWQARKMA